MPRRQVAAALPRTNVVPALIIPSFAAGVRECQVMHQGTFALYPYHPLDCVARRLYGILGA
jgi:hypothetical protein